MTGPPSPSWNVPFGGKSTRCSPALSYLFSTSELNRAWNLAVASGAIRDSARAADIKAERISSSSKRLAEVMAEAPVSFKLTKLCLSVKRQIHRDRNVLMGAHESEGSQGVTLRSQETISSCSRSSRNISSSYCHRVFAWSKTNGRVYVLVEHNLYLSILTFGNHVFEFDHYQKCVQKTAYDV